MKSKKQQILLQLQKRLYFKPMALPALLPEKIPDRPLLQMHGESSLIPSKVRSKAGLCMLHLHLKQLKKLLGNIKSESAKVDYTQQDLVKKISYFINIWCYLQIIFFFSHKQIVLTYSTAKLEFGAAKDFVYTPHRRGPPYAWYIIKKTPFLGSPAVGGGKLGGRICILRVKELKVDLSLSPLKLQYLKGRLIVTNPKLLAYLLYALITQGRLPCGGSITRKGARSFLCYQISYKNKPPGSFVYSSSNRLFTLGKAKNQLTIMSTSGVFIKSLLPFHSYTCNHIKINTKKKPILSSPPALRPRGVSKKHIKKNKKFYKCLSFCDYIVFKIIWKWCSRKHGNQSAQWIRYHYFYKLNGQSWVFALKKINMLHNLAPCFC